MATDTTSFTNTPQAGEGNNLVTGGFISYSGVNGNADTPISFDSNGTTAGGTTGQLVILQGLAFTSSAATQALLADNYVVT